MRFDSNGGCQRAVCLMVGPHQVKLRQACGRLVVGKAEAMTGSRLRLAVLPILPLAVLPISPRALPAICPHCRPAARAPLDQAGAPPTGPAAAAALSWTATQMRSTRRRQARGGSASGRGMAPAGGSWPTMLGWRCVSRRRACMCLR